MRERTIAAAGLALSLFIANAAVGSSLFTRVRYTGTVTGTGSASDGANNWITADANAFHAKAVDQYHFYNSSPVTSSRVDGVISDTYTLSGAGAGDTVPVTVEFGVDYSIEASGTSGYGYQVHAHMTGDAGASAAYTFNRDAGGGITTSGNPDVSFTQVIPWVVGTSKNLAFDVLLYSSGSGSTDAPAPTMSQSTQVIVHAENTAAINFVLPAGVTMTSQLGWTPVPEPALLAAAPLAMLLWRRRRPH